MSNDQWNSDQAEGERALREWKKKLDNVGRLEAQVTELQERMTQMVTERRETQQKIAHWVRTTPMAGGKVLSYSASPDLALVADAIESGEWRK